MQFHQWNVPVKHYSRVSQVNTLKNKVFCTPYVVQA